MHKLRLVYQSVGILNLPNSLSSGTVYKGKYKMQDCRLAITYWSHVANLDDANQAQPESWTSFAHQLGTYKPNKDMIRL
jgi:hypothetical protein